MRMDKLTNPLQQALSDAQSLAVGRDHNFIEPLHVLAALLQQAGGVSRPLLQKAGANPQMLEQSVEQALAALPKCLNSATALRYLSCLSVGCLAIENSDYIFINF